MDAIYSEQLTLPLNKSKTKILPWKVALRRETAFRMRSRCHHTGLLKKKYTLSKIYFTSTIERMATRYI
jgi:hypothetical protein